jgi:hypothetical protein
MKTLLPCPFCGFPEVRQVSRCGTYWIECFNCQTSGPGRLDEQGSIDAWNTRPGTITLKYGGRGAPKPLDMEDNL